MSKNRNTQHYDSDVLNSNRNQMCVYYMRARKLDTQIPVALLMIHTQRCRNSDSSFSQSMQTVLFVIFFFRLLHRYFVNVLISSLVCMFFFHYCCSHC